MSAAKILVVEDNLVVAKGLTMQLQRHGYLVDHVVEASQAETSVKTALPDLIILDVGLPTRDPNSPMWDGLDFLEWLHWMKIEVPVIIYSSTSPKLIQARLREARAVAYFQKPAPMKEMLAAIDAAIPKKPESQPSVPLDAAGGAAAPPAL